MRFIILYNCGLLLLREIKHVLLGCVGILVMHKNVAERLENLLLLTLTLYVQPIL